jgi:glycosyltransferase involved in cell wall biosynthesis
VIAARKAGVPLVVAGDGPDLPRLRDLAGEGDVRFTGLLTRDALAELRRDAAVALAPSRCEEAGPYSVLDGCAAGIPVLASERTGRPELLSPAAILPAGDVHAWTEALARVWRDPSERGRLGAQTLERARELLGEERYYRGLMDVYGGA